MTSSVIRLVAEVAIASATSHQRRWRPAEVITVVVCSVHFARICLAL